MNNNANVGRASGAPHETVNHSAGDPVPPASVPRTEPIASYDLPILRFKGKQAFAVTFIVGDTFELDEGDGVTALLNDDVLYVLAHSREEAVAKARKALLTRNDGHCPYTIVGVHYIDQLLAMAQCAYRTLAGISPPTDAGNSDDPPHEYIKPYAE